MDGHRTEVRRQVSLVGIGMGALGTFTMEAVQAIRESDCVIGAKRMLEAASAAREETGADAKGTKVICCAYQPEQIREILAAHPQCRKIAVLYSGDIGFYSGAREVYQVLKDDYEVKGIPGISSVICFAARLHVSWADARLISIHGRKQPYIHILARHPKTFLLFGGSGQEEEFCQRIREYGLTHLKIWIGGSLSYEEESILYRTGEEIRPEDLRGLVLLYIENPSPLAPQNGQIRDDAFIRGNVPMTKEEVRAISIAKLELSGEAVLYDVGAGTGSIAVTAAALYENVRVYAVEKKSEGVELIRKNRRKFCADQLEIIEGTAPEALRDLEPPTHVFIGGSSGNLREILSCIRGKSPGVRVVLNAVTLETMKEILIAEEEGLLTETEILQAGIVKARRLAGYHMMTGQNPVYIVSARVEDG